MCFKNIKNDPNVLKIAIWAILDRLLRPVTSPIKLKVPYTFNLHNIDVTLSCEPKYLKCCIISVHPI